MSKSNRNFSLLKVILINGLTCIVEKAGGGSIKCQLNLIKEQLVDSEFDIFWEIHFNRNPIISRSGRRGAKRKEMAVVSMVLITHR